MPKPSQTPASSYAEAVTRIEAGLTPSSSYGTVNPLYETVFLGHGRKTAQAFILLHGYTISPYQFREMGQALFERGFNVLIPRMPNHGFRELINDGLKELSRTVMVDYANVVVDAAAGLSDSITAMGLSAGGVLASYMGSFRPEINRSVLISPALAPYMIPPALNGLVIGLTARLPNRNMWWGEEGDMGSEDDHGYPRLSTRGLAGIMQVGELAQRRARRKKPFIDEAILLMNHNDFSVQPAAAHALFNSWAAKGVATQRYTFDASHNLDHDMIAPWHPQANTALVYGKLFDMLGV